MTRRSTQRNQATGPTIGVHHTVLAADRGVGILGEHGGRTGTGHAAGSDRQPDSSLIHHTDRGRQYAGKQYRAVLRRAEMQQSMSGADNCYDNAFRESCFATLKTELEVTGYADAAEARRELSEYVGYYNVTRRHSSLGYVSPVEFETRQTSRK